MKYSEKMISYEKDYLTEAIRREIKLFIEKIIIEELEATIGVGLYERGEGRRGYRHGYEARQLSTSLGKSDIKVPRARLFADGATIEWRSQMLPRYRRRAKAVDDAILGLYLCGANTRRIRKALQPLLKGTPLSKSSISRLVGRLKEEFEVWQRRALHNELLVHLYLDGFGAKVRCGGRVSSIPVLAAVGVRPSGEKILLGLWLRGSESVEAWEGVLEDLTTRGLPRPLLVIIDGNQCLRLAVETTWPKIDVQRCTVHKLKNLLSHAPKHAHEAIREDYHTIIYAASLEEAKVARERFIKQWRNRCEGVVKSLLEAGDELLTFFRYPESQWRSLRSTNIIERIYGEFRRRIKTQLPFPTESAVLIMLYGLFASGQMTLRKIPGWRDMPEIIKKKVDKVA